MDHDQQADVAKKHLMRRIQEMTTCRRFPTNRHMRYTHPSIGNYSMYNNVTVRLLSNVEKVPLQMQLTPAFFRVKHDDLFYND